MAKPVFMTPREASTYTGLDAGMIKRAMVDPKYAEIFKDQTDMLTFENLGVNYKPVRRATKEAIDKWVVARNERGTKRASRSTGRRETIHVTDEQRDQVIAALAPFGISFVEKKAKSANKPASAPASTSETNGQVFEHELVEA